jgi:integrase
VQELWRGRQLAGRRLFHIGGKPLGALRSEWARACRAAGIVLGRKAGGVVLYNLRHSCLTNLAEAGVPDSTAPAISGHKTDSAHRRYVITQPSA